MRNVNAFNVIQIQTVHLIMLAIKRDALKYARKEIHVHIMHCVLHSIMSHNVLVLNQLQLEILTHSVIKSKSNHIMIQNQSVNSMRIVQVNKFAYQTHVIHKHVKNFILAVIPLNAVLLIRHQQEPSFVHAHN